MVVNLCSSEAILLKPADLMREMNEIKAAGAQRVRTGADWKILERTKGVYTFAALDRVVDAAHNAGLVVDMLITAPRPSYRSTTADYGRLMGRVAAHYVPLGVHDFECWNEENNAANWGTNTFGYFCTGPKPAEYVGYLSAAYDAIKNVSTDTTVIFGGLEANATFSGFPRGNVSIDPVEFLKRCYPAVKGKFDVLAYHAYSSTDSFGKEEPTAQQKYIAKTRDLHDVLVANGDGDKPIRINEFGFDTTGQTQTQQHDWLAQQWVIMSSFEFVDHFYVYCYRNTGSGTGKNSNFGLINYDWSHKLAYDWLVGVNGV